MSLIGQQIAEGKIRHKYLTRATKKQLIECLFERHKAEDKHYQGASGDFLKDSWPRRCKHCGVLLFPDKWEPVESTESDCEHESIGYVKKGKYKNTGRFPQECKLCGKDLKPKTWKKMHDENNT